MLKVLSLGMLVALYGCGSGYRERKAPCLRPITATAYGPDDSAECGPLSKINVARSDGLAAIEHLLGP
ncbi:hypothetical protein NCHU2750_12390 [Neorhizobium sp. NCHU2750]|nr:hypothetical protein NCHU2750_12390 [Neorhizobium sp. NCHU2750]